MVFKELRILQKLHLDVLHVATWALGRNLIPDSSEGWMMQQIIK